MGVYLKGITLAELLNILNSDAPHELHYVEVEEPHGRLIDESKISEATRWRGGYEMTMSGNVFETDAPTVIESEGM